jgi:exodeoxyribonuclease V
LKKDYNLFNDQQKDALKAVDKWLTEWYTSRKPNKKFYYLAGFAGTGKTTLAKHFAENVDGDVFFSAFTGKAALVMRKNGCEGARTIHSLIYLADQDAKTGEVTFHLNKSSPLRDAKLIIVDECSMVDEDLAKDLMYFNKPILVLGDPGQLPPVKGTGFFTSGKPDFMLTEIHRQAKDSPIIYLATQARQGIMPDVGDYDESRVIDRMATKDVLEVDQVLVGRNITRQDLNRKMRKLLKLDPDNPVVGDKIICLQNDKDLGIFNGGIFDIQQILRPKYKTNFLHMSVESQDEDRPPLMVKVHKSFFMDDVGIPDWKTLKGSQQFDYSYALSTHKAQGSQWNSVLVQDESWCFREERWRWLYTSITRASEKVTLVRN